MSTFSTLAEYYDRIFPIQDTTARFLEASISHPRAKLLDIGCGVGSHVRFLADTGHDVLGIDFSEAMVAAGQQEHPDLSFRVMDMMDIDQLSGPYGMAYSLGNVVSHLSTESLTEFLSRLESLLAAQGTWLFQVVNWDKILHEGSMEFPEKRVGTNVIFHRQYEAIGRKSVQFVTELEVDGQVHQDRETLYPIMSEQYLAIHAAAGFNLAAHYGSYVQDEYDRLASRGNVFLFRKGNRKGK